MTISVIIPSYNQQEYLADCIESVLTQTIKPYEIIVVDDGSTDNSLEIARKYPVTVVSQRNKGLSAARNTGIMNSSGDYILPLDADDMLMENCIEVMTKAINETKCDIIAPSFKEFGVRNQPLILTGMPTLEDFKTANRLPYFCAIRRSALLECGGYSPRMTWGWEDFHIWFDLITRNKSICIIQIPLVLYRTKAQSMIHVANAHAAELHAQIIKDFPSVFSV
jgi:glycosyltransferase involved in cell wall biosynthesis